MCGVHDSCLNPSLHAHRYTHSRKVLLLNNLVRLTSGRIIPPIFHPRSRPCPTSKSSSANHSHLPFLSSSPSPLQGMDAIPIDLLLGSMSSELYHVLRGHLPQEVLDFFMSGLPHPKLAVLVFAEFTTVDALAGGGAPAAPLFSVSAASSGASTAS